MRRRVPRSEQLSWLLGLLPAVVYVPDARFFPLELHRMILSWLPVGTVRATALARAPDDDDRSVRIGCVAIW